MGIKKTATILIAEDDRSMSKALELKLKKSGLNVLTAYDGEEALNILDQGGVDLMLLDLIMPKVDGFSVLEEIKKKNIKVKIIITSNLSQEEDLQRAKEFGVSDYLVKSDTPIQDIVNKVKALA